MPLSTGERLGPYEILAAIGAGGMGEVYKARDTRLGRTVAVKVLPEHIASRKDLRARFEREARVVACLNHPNICTLHDIGPGYMVMELIDGETLAARIAKGALALDLALQFAIQIADALDRAHRAGVTHRDVKPQNIMLTRDGVKVLDFGLAKSARPSKPGPTEETLTAALTTEGTVVGTPQYMAPEQFEGKESDARGDIWAFGAVLYEMVTGKRAFQGKNYSSLLGAILAADPPPMSVKPFTPSWLERLVRRCLAKDPDDRWQTMRDVVIELRNPPRELAAVAPSKAARWPWILAAGVLAVALGIALWAPWRAGGLVEMKPLVRLDVELGPNAITAAYNTFAISPDGERLVFTIRGADGKTRLATRLLSEGKTTILEGTENPQNPFFSPDGAWIAYAADGKLRKVSTRGGAPLVICDDAGGYGGAWTDEGMLVVSRGNASALARVPAAGGSPELLGKLSGSDITYRWPQALPGAEYVLASASASISSFASATIVAVSTKTGEVRRLVEGAYAARFVAGPFVGQGAGHARSVDHQSLGHLLYLRGASLFAVGFDRTKLEIQGEAVPVADEMGGDSESGAGHWEVSRTGVLLHDRGRRVNGAWPVQWMDRTGQTRPLLSEDRAYRTMRFSPDGSRLALSVGADGGADMYVYNLTRDVLSRLTSVGKGKHPVDYPTWTPDGKHIISAYPGSSGFGLAWYRADGGGEPQILLDSKVRVFPTSVSPDGKRIAYTRVDPVTSYDVWVLPLDTTDPEHPKAGTPQVFVQLPGGQIQPSFSPDARWISYLSDENGVRNEVYVRPYPGPGGKWQVSKDGGMFPLWSADGRWLYFLNRDRQIMVVDYEAKGDVFTPGKSRPWSPAPIGNPTGLLPYALHPDGKRFAVFPVPETAPQEKGNAHVTFLLNFGDELRRRLPPGK